jgi:calcium-dependent protein kinase
VLQIDVLLTLRGTLNVACLHAVYEDKDSVYMVMDLCTGGELLQRIKAGDHTERSVRNP